MYKKRALAFAVILILTLSPITQVRAQSPWKPAAAIAADASASQDSLPDGLAASDWSSIRAAYEANRHAAFDVQDGYQARNPGQAWRTRFDGRGFLTTADSGDWSWGLELVSYGVGDAQRSVNGVAPANSRCGQRVEYEWDETLTEWYINDDRGLEHGYTVHQRPVWHCSVVSSAGEDPSGHGGGAWRQAPGEQPELLQFTLATRGELRPQVSDDGRNVSFVNAAGAAVVSYSGLTVIDADAVTLPGWFESTGEELRLFVDDRGGRYPLTIDPIAQQAYLKASNTEEGDWFGYSVAMSGDTVVIGAAAEDSSAVGVDGDQTDDGSPYSGAAYVFVRSPGSPATWSQQAYLKASNTDTGDQFGGSVAVFDDTVVVGATEEDSSTTGVNGNQADNGGFSSGAAYVFVRAGGVWSQQAYLKASNTGVGDSFGGSVAGFGDTVVVGATAESSSATGVDNNQFDNTATWSGATYVFVRDAGGVWSQHAYLKASNTYLYDYFGRSVAVSGDTIVVGATGESSNATGVNGDQSARGANEAGAAYVFVRSGTTWSQQAYLKASNTGADDEFGISVALSGDTAVIGAWGERSSATGVDGDQTNNSAVNSGATYVFVRGGGGDWSQQAYLKASNTDAYDYFGKSVAVSGNWIVVGAPEEDSDATGVNGDQGNSAFNAGAGYVFLRDANGVWTQRAYLKASNTAESFAAGDQFGYAVCISGDTVVTGAWQEDSIATGVNGNQADNSAAASGVAYVFTGLCVPVIDDQPDSQTVCEGTPAMFTVAAAGDLSYQWRKNEIELSDEPNHISGAQSPSLVIVNTTTDDVGGYDCVVTNACASATSDEATLEVFVSGGGDANADLLLDGADVAAFVAAALAGEPPNAGVCAADMNLDGVVNELDVPPFVAALLGE